MRRRSVRSGFTLIELLVALVIMVTALTIIYQTFNGVIDAWDRGQDMMEELHHGDFVMEQLVSALRSTAYFKTAPDKYGFRMEDRSGGYPEDMISFVTTSSAFLPQDSLWAGGIHRVVFTIENNSDGQPAVAIRARSFLSEEEDMDGEPWFVSTEVKGFDCRIYNMEDEDWETDWDWDEENTNKVPSLLEITLYMDPIEEYGDPITLKRAVQIPVAPPLTNAVNDADTQQTGDAP